MIDGFLSGLVLGFLVWVAIIWWHRSRLAKADKVWMDAIKATQHSTWAVPKPTKKRTKKRK